jgi:hypothetical protein
MAVQRYVFDLGVANAGGSPDFSAGFFKSLDSLGDLTPPVIHEIADGQYYFEADVGALGSFTFKVIFNGAEVFDSIPANPSVPLSRYAFDLGLVNAGGGPDFSAGYFKRLDTLADLAQPPISEIGKGAYYFDVPWASFGGIQTISFKIVFGGAEVADVIDNSTAVGSTANYSAAGEIIGRAMLRCALLSLNQAQLAAYDPYASTTADANLFVDLLRGLGNDLGDDIKSGLYKIGTINTASGATSYPVPADYNMMVDQTGWNGFIPMLGPVTEQRAAFLRAWTPAGLLRIPFQILSNRFAFPVAPSNGLTLHYSYVSTYWTQSNGSPAPDKPYPTAASDLVLFDEELLILGLRLRYRSLKGFDTTTDLSAYQDRLNVARGNAAGGQVLSLEGPRGGVHFLDEMNIPPAGYGIP